MKSGKQNDTPTPHHLRLFLFGDISLCTLSARTRLPAYGVGVITAGEVAHPPRGDMHGGSDGWGGGGGAPGRGALARDQSPGGLLPRCIRYGRRGGSPARYQGAEEEQFAHCPRTHEHGPWGVVCTRRLMTMERSGGYIKHNR